MRYVAIFLAAYLPGCVSIKTHEKGVLEAYKRGLQRSSVFMSRYDCSDAKWLVGSEITGAELQELKFQ